MKYPKLVPPSVCKTKIMVTINRDEIGEYGESEVQQVGSFYCNYQATSKRIYTSDTSYIQLSGIALLDGDAFDMGSNPSDGEAVITGRTFRIHSVSKMRNPDGSVNYTKVELI